MNIINLTLSNLKRYIKSPSLILPMILIPIVSVSAFFTIFNDNDSSIPSVPFALVCNLDGEYEEKLIKELNLKENVFLIEDKGNAITLLKNNKISSVFILDENFSNDINSLKNPTVKSVKVEDGGGSIFAESKINKFISSSLKSKSDNKDINLITSKIVEKKSSFGLGSTMPIFFTSYLLYLFAYSFCKDLLDLKKSNVLKRMLSTKNKDFEILFSLCLSLFIVQASASSLSLILINVINGIEINISMILIVIANSFVVTGLVMFLCRVFKTDAAISMATTLYALLSAGLSIPTLIPSLSMKIPFLHNLAKLSPIYWVFEALNGKSIILSLIALILMGLVFVTCGSFKLRNFAKN
ncbi:ABC transporter permease [[Clostridium] dakarense]|uniref:ABC transporter permease n=1 Tax=Faecalimicrobium dakarense TaxID=1301100 RepID=UPI0004BA7093|nr:ABC transporter permease [[Clostridium] dakarense]